MIHHDHHCNWSFGNCFAACETKTFPYLPSTHPLWSTLSHPHGAEHGSVSLGHGKVIYLQYLDDLLTTTGHRAARPLLCRVSRWATSVLRKSTKALATHQRTTLPFTISCDVWSQVRGINIMSKITKVDQHTALYICHWNQWNHWSTKTANAQTVESFSRGASSWGSGEAEA